MAPSPEDGSSGPVGIQIKLAGKAMGDEVQVQSIRVMHAVNRIPEARFTVLSQSLQIEDFTEIDSANFNPGTEVEIAAFYGEGDEQSLFKGIIVANRMRLDGTRGMRMELTCRDKVLALTEVRTSASYEQIKDSDLMNKIIEDAGLSSDIAATKVVRPIEVRVGASDWDFLRLLADRNGMVMTVQDGRITAAAPDTGTAPVLSATNGMDVMELDISVDAQRMIKDAGMRAWDPATQEAVAGASAPTDVKPLGNTPLSDLSRVLSDRQLGASTARENTAAALKEMASARVMRAGLAAIHGSVKFQGTGKVWPADMLEIRDTGNRFGGNGFVSGVEHTIDGGSWTTQVQLGLPQDWSTDAHGVSAPPAEALSTPIHGLQIGKVQAVSDDPENQQRIQISLPMIGAEPAVVWARFAQPYASGAAGIQFLPEVGDEVLVAFLNADPNAPVIVGALHNTKALRASEATPENFVKGIVTRENLKMSFDDEKKVITVETPGGHVLTLDDDTSTFSLKDMNGNSIVMDSGGITLSSDQDITLSATGNVVIEATQDAQMTGNNVTCEGQIGFTGKGGGTAELSAGGQTKVEGSIVMIN